MFYALLGAAIVILVLYLVMRVIGPTKRTDQEGSIPGMQPRNESAGNLPDIAAAGSMHVFLAQLHQKYGPVASFWFGPKRAVSIYKPHHFKEYSAIFDRPLEFFQAFEPIFGITCVQFANGEDGRRRHALYARCFSETRMAKYYNVWNEVSWDILRKLSDLPQGEHIAIREYTFDVSIKSVLLGAFGKYFDDDDRIQEIKRNHNVLWDNLELILSGNIAEPGSERELEFQRNRQNLAQTVRKLVEWRANNPPADEADRLVVDVLIELHGQDEETLFADALQTLIAGIHTTAQLMYWCLYYLARDQDVQDRVLHEMDTVMGDEDDVTIDNYADLVFTSQVLDETLRCSQLAPFVARVADRDMKLTDGSVTYTVPEGTPVAMPLGVSLHDTDLWPNPDHFDPDRFDPKTYKPTPFGFEPFGFAGKRKCLGFRFARHEATVFLTHALRRFKFSLVPGQTVKKLYGLVITTAEDIWLTVEPRATT